MKNAADRIEPLGRIVRAMVSSSLNPETFWTTRPPEPNEGSRLPSVL